MSSPALWLQRAVSRAGLSSLDSDLKAHKEPKTVNNSAQTSPCANTDTTAAAASLKGRSGAGSGAGSGSGPPRPMSRTSVLAAAAAIRVPELDHNDSSSSSSSSSSAGQNQAALHDGMCHKDQTAVEQRSFRAADEKHTHWCKTSHRHGIVTRSTSKRIHLNA